MRSILLGGAMFAALAATSIGASAQGTQGSGGNDRFCASMSGGDSATGPQCLYRTMAQCQEAVKGGKGTCTENPKRKKM
jgi:hypothetical protein